MMFLFVLKIKLSLDTQEIQSGWAEALKTKGGQCIGIGRVFI